MKRYSIIALALVLGCTLFTGCRRGDMMNQTDSPTAPAATQAPTMPETRPTTPAVTEPATQHATEPMTQHATEGTTNGATEHATEGTTPRSRTARPNMQ